MSEEIELKLLREIEGLKKKIRHLEKKDEEQIPTFQYSKIRDADLINLVDIENNIKEKDKFDNWFESHIKIDNTIEPFLKKLIEDNEPLIESYSEEDLKINFLAPLISRVEFKSYENEFRDFYELPLTYKTDKFILSGTADFVVSTGLVRSKKPYFFIQEFKRSEEYGNPKPQLLAELITGVELNEWKLIKGAYVIGGNWHFVILEKLGQDKYQFFVSKNFDSTKLSDLKMIYKNLLFIKNEIITMVKA